MILSGSVFFCFHPTLRHKRKRTSTMLATTTALLKAERNESENLQISVQEEVGRTCGRIDSAREGWGGGEERREKEGSGEGDFGEKGALH